MAEQLDLLIDEDDPMPVAEPKSFIVRVIDFETTGMTATDEPVEVGWSDLRFDRPTLNSSVSHYASELINPGRPIPPEAMAVHHITDAMVKDAPKKAGVFAEVFTDEPDYFAAHNARFDRQFAPKTRQPWVCTYKASYRLWPNAAGHSNQYLRYWLGLDVGLAHTDLPHRAGPDALVTAQLLRLMLARGMRVTDAAEWTEQPVLLYRVSFGKHAGALWEEVPLDYLQWMTTKGDFDEDAMFTAQHWLNRKCRDRNVMRR